MKVIIIDDEQNARENLHRKIKKFDADIDIVGESDNVDTAYSLIKKLKPDVIFLDIEMPEKDGFELVGMFDKADFHIVFVTAYNEYAVKAFQNFAFNYILKPIDTDHLYSVLSKLQNISPAKKNDEFKSILQLLNHSVKQSHLAVPTEEGLEMLAFNDIINIESNDGYTMFKTVKGNSILSSKRLNYFEEILSGKSFVRISRSAYANIKYIQSFQKAGSIILVNGEQLNISKRYKNLVYDTLKQGVNLEE